MSEIQPSPAPGDDNDGVSAELQHLFEAFRATPAPPPDLSDEELIAQIRETAAHPPPASPPPPHEDGR